MSPEEVTNWIILDSDDTTPTVLAVLIGGNSHSDGAVKHLDNARALCLVATHPPGWT